MSRAAQAFKQTDVTKAIRAAKNAGMEVGRFEIGRDGKIVVIAGKPLAQGSAADGENPWNDVA
jgi:imidazolonepropionase-like amidohydrolase